MISFTGRGILLDIEGTTSSIHFVHDVLFPYARRHLELFLAAHWDDAKTRAACEQIARDAGTTLKSKDDVRAEVERLMDGDVKATGLKELQGLIWEEGFRSGELRSHVYDDVPAALKRWRDAGRDVRIYSSGSVQAQKLFFAHTVHGDLLSLFRGHYDTRIGGKKEAASYRAIAEDMRLPATEILFVSDIPAELDAAFEAGMQTALAVRPGNAEAAIEGRSVVTDFSQIESR